MASWLYAPYKRSESSDNPRALSQTPLRALYWWRAQEKREKRPRVYLLSHLETAFHEMPACRRQLVRDYLFVCASIGPIAVKVGSKRIHRGTEEAGRYNGKERQRNTTKSTLNYTSCTLFGKQLFANEIVTKNKIDKREET
jgi:hypothetical protein